MDLNRAFKTIFFIDIIKGLALTLKSMFTRPVTRQYPEEKREAAPGFRGLHALVRDPSTGREKCIACGLCAAVCPSQCIYIYTGESNEDGKKQAEIYDIEVLRCVYCALCVEACPVGAVALTEHFEYADYDRESFYMTKEKLLENWDKYMAGEKGDQYFKRFWYPATESYKKTYQGQAVFKGKAARG